MPAAALPRADHVHPSAIDLALAVEQALLETHRPELALVHVEVCAGRVHLRGRVSSFHALQCALAAVQRVDGISTICSLIEVRPVR
jgi:osmotically-inducible protein OsmY